MLTRRLVLVAAAAASVFAFEPALARNPQPFKAQSFADAQKTGEPILVAIHASWCPTCKAQKPVLSKLTSDPKFKKLAFFEVDFDSQKDLVRSFGARVQSTLIVFKGDKEEGRSVGDTNAASIETLLNKAL